MLLWATGKSCCCICYEQVFHSHPFIGNLGKKSCILDPYRIGQLWRAVREAGAFPPSFCSPATAASCRASPQLAEHYWWFPYFIAQVLKNAFVLLPYSWRGREERQAGRKSRHVAQNCIWGGALLMLVLNMWLFSALSSWGVLAGSNSQSSSQVPYVSWRCLSSGLV